MHCKECGKDLNDKKNVCVECGKELENDDNLCSNCAETLKFEESLEDNQELIEEIAPEESLLNCENPPIAIRGFGIASMVLGIISVVGLLFDIIIPGGMIGLLACAILALVFSKKSKYTKGAKFGRVGYITGLIACVLIPIQILIILVCLAIYCVMAGIGIGIAILEFIFLIVFAITALIGIILRIGENAGSY